MRKFDVAIIGGGAAGLMAAISAARKNCKVAVLEHNNRVGKKILSTGNGKCNLTNLKQDTGCYHGMDPAFTVPIFRQFSVNDTMNFFREIGVLLTDKNGYVYPRCGQASAVLDALKKECLRLGVQLMTDCEISAVKQTKNGFEVHTNTELFWEKSLIFAPGGFSASKLGSDGSAYQYIENFGHTTQNIVPGLVALKTNESYFKSLAGIRAEISLKLLVENKEIAAETGELQLTNYGISGIPVFQLSRYAAYALKERKKVEMLLDFASNFSEEMLLEELKKRLKYARCNQKFEATNLEEYLNGYLNKKLNLVLLKLVGLKPTDSILSLSENDLRKLAKQTKYWRVVITDTLAFEQSQVSAGGVPASELNFNMESKLIDGLYFAGEVVDIDGICGGYNLQWAWSSGFVAGRAAAERSIHAAHS